MPAGPPRAAQTLTPVVTEVVGRAGFVLDDLEVRPAGRRQVVRVTVDTAEVPGPDDGPAPGVDLDAVAGLSRELSAALDDLEGADDGPGPDPVPGGEYTLEVTTPGTDRPLTRPGHWRRAWLRKVAITGTDGSETVGRVGPVEGTADDPDDDPDSPADATVTLASTDRRGLVTLGTVALADVARAVVEVEFKPAPPGEIEALRDAARTRQDPATQESRDPS